MSEMKTVPAKPTKGFFVEMLTRDIELKDALLDLLDNCLDGVLRQQQQGIGNVPISKNRPYEGYWAKIELSLSHFQITDNCGGIPREVAEKSAFMLGRPKGEIDPGIATVGMYGIGMKRAIFKLGTDATVNSTTTNESFEVRIVKKWLDDDDDWYLPIVNVEHRLSETGTRIRVEGLGDAIRPKFDPQKPDFIDDFKKEVSQIYSRILEKGFNVFVNDDPIDARHLTLISAGHLRAKDGLRPFVFKGEILGVDVLVAVGFYRPLPSVDEIDDEQVSPLLPRTKEVAGWTVICNDRVVLYADKTHVTGWGTATVPRFHNQFIAIAGLVVFHSTEALRLPLTTTKRGIETSSAVYAMTLEIMREGVKKFTEFTNRWKGRESETKSAFAEAQAMTISEIESEVIEGEWNPVRRLGTSGSGKRFSPDLPKPISADASRRISFSRSLADVKTVAEHLFGDEDAPPSEVGARCFDDVLKKARKR